MRTPLSSLVLAALSIAVTASLACTPAPLGASSGPATSAEPAESAPPRVEASPDAKSLAEAHARFGLKLFGLLKPTEQQKNVFVSPASLALALQLVHAGASGDTQSALGRTLELSPMAPDALHAAALNLQQALAGADPKVKLRLATSVWARQGLTLNESFVDTSRRFFQASASAVDFTSPSAPKAINDWVNGQTNGRIKEIVSDLDPMTAVVLVNALSFQGTWSKPFEKKDTREQDFFTDAAGTTALGRVKMMSVHGDFAYLEEPAFQAARIPYGDGRLAMYVLLPAKTSSLDALVARLTPAEWTRVRGQLQSRSGQLSIPRFQLRYGESLRAPLKALGMELPFSERADFRALATPGPLKLDDVLHRTFVEVSEEGTKAAAATAVVAVGSAAPGAPVPSFAMVVDRPFFCAIHDSDTGALLFVGAVRDPR